MSLQLVKSALQENGAKKKLALRTELLNLFSVSRGHLYLKVSNEEGSINRNIQRGDFQIADEEHIL